MFGIYGLNNFKLLVQDNDFTAPADTGYCVFFKNININSSHLIDVEPQSELPFEESPYQLNLIHNTFTGGNYSAALVNFAQNYLGYLIKENTFNYAHVCNLILRAGKWIN